MAAGQWTDVLSGSLHAMVHVGTDGATGGDLPSNTDVAVTG